MWKRHETRETEKGQYNRINRQKSRDRKRRGKRKKKDCVEEALDKRDREEETI